MMTDRPWEVIAAVKLFPSDRGGRRGPTPADAFGCLMEVGGVTFDVRLQLDQIGSLAPGQEARVPMCFLDPDFAKRYCSIGRQFVLRELQAIGEGVIEDTAFSTESEAASAVRIA